VPAVHTPDALDLASSPARDFEFQSRERSSPISFLR